MIGGVQMSGLAALRPVLVGLLLVADAGIVLVLGIGRHKGWLPPFIGFGIVLVGLIWIWGGRSATGMTTTAAS